MQKRKVRNAEIERQKRNKQRVMQSLFVLCAVLIVVGIGGIVWDSINRRTIMHFNGEPISVGDFRFQGLLFNAPLNAETRDFAIESLLNTLVVLDRGERHGIGATAAEINEMEEIAVMVRAQMNEQNPGSLDFISDRRVAELLAAEIVSERLSLHYFSDFEPDATELAEALAEHIEEHRQFLYTMYVKYIVSEDSFGVAEAHERFMDGEDIDILVQEFSDDYDPDEGVQPMEIAEFIGMNNMWEHIDELIELEEGEITAIIQMGELYYIVTMYSRFFDYEEIEETFREHFTENARQIAFVEQLQEWAQEADYEINTRALNRFR